MILTCPACDTKYVVKDDAIPPQGRQVRCASCKHSWHQDPDLVLAEPASDADLDLGGPPPLDPESAEMPLAEAPTDALAEGEIAGEPQPEPDPSDDSPWGTVSPEPIGSPMPLSDPADEVAMEEAPAIADEWRAPATVGVSQPAEEDFVGYSPIDDDEQGPRRRWPVILAILLVIAMAAAAFWFFAPPEWKERAGIAQAGATPLQLMITNQQRRVLDSGNPIIEISGRVINPTDRQLQVPPIRAELLDSRTKQVVHRWTIDPPTSVLAPGSSASFNSAELGVPEAGDQLTLTLGANS